MEYTKQKIAAEVRQIITDHVGHTHSEIADEKSLVLDLGFNTLDEVELVMDVEEHFEIVITEDEAQTTNTVGELIGIVVRKLEEKGQVAA